MDLNIDFDDNDLGFSSSAATDSFDFPPAALASASQMTYVDGYENTNTRTSLAKSQSLTAVPSNRREYVCLYPGCEKSWPTQNDLK